MIDLHRGFAFLTLSNIGMMNHHSSRILGILMYEECIDILIGLLAQAEADFLSFPQYCNPDFI